MQTGYDVGLMWASSQRDVSDSSGGQPVQRDVMRDSVEGCAEVEENQDGE